MPSPYSLLSSAWARAAPPRPVPPRVVLRTEAGDDPVIEFSPAWWYAVAGLAFLVVLVMLIQVIAKLRRIELLLLRR